MKLTKLHLIIILALALIICPVLGVCQNNIEGMYSHQPNKKRETMNDDQHSKAALYAQLQQQAASASNAGGASTLR
jgi:hypothetical protein